MKMWSCYRCRKANKMYDGQKVVLHFLSTCGVVEILVDTKVCKKCVKKLHKSLEKWWKKCNLCGRVNCKHKDICQPEG